MIDRRAIPTFFRGVQFRSRLEARWAAFFDLIGWNWQYEPLDLDGWIPDFMVTFPCGHSECSGSRTLLVEIKPFRSLAEFAGHPCLDYPYGFKRGSYPEGRIPADASAAFGLSPETTYWEMGHGSGGGEEDITNWADGNLDMLWKEAGNLVQWRGVRSETR